MALKRVIDTDNNSTNLWFLRRSASASYRYPFGFTGSFPFRASDLNPRSGASTL